MKKSFSFLTFGCRTGAALVLASTLVVGCKSNRGSGGASGASASQAQSLVRSDAKRITPPVGSSRLKAGAAPLSYEVTSGGNIRINDIGDDRELLRGTVAPNTQITIDQHNGIMVGGENAVPGPLPLAHRYEIYLDR